MIHVIEHALGLCGEGHPSIIALISEWPTIAHIINYIKTWR